MASPFAGVWELSSDQWGGRAVFTDTDYAFIITTNDRGAPPKPRTAYTDAEAAALLEGLGASSGAYEVSGSTWTRRPLVAANPEQVGTESAMEFSLDGDELTWVGGLIPDQGDLVWRKVG